MSWNKYWFVIEKIGGRYFLIAGTAFLLFYLLLKNVLASKKIQQRYPMFSDYAREIGYSILTIAIFTSIPVLLIMNPAVRPYTTYNTDINQHGWFYFFAAFFIMLILPDTYFYWSHRLMHHKRLFNYFHLVHHQSVNPSPRAAYAFHPLEAIVEVGIVLIFLFTIPIHTFHLPFFFLFMIVYNVYGHPGYELYPKGFSKNPIGKWINTSVNHNQHHQYYKGNYGLYFLSRDRVMGTIRADYVERFEEVKNRSHEK